ncbi:MAG: GNAT family N-acetyltransferase [Myxococcota bacterium]
MMAQKLKSAVDAFLSRQSTPPSTIERNGVSVRVVESLSEFESLGPAWEELQEQAILTSVFETHDWQYLWWKTYGRDRKLRLLVASAEGKLVGVLPLYIQTQTVMRCPVRVLRLVGTGGDTSPDDLGAVLARGREREVAEALAEAVSQLSGWDLLLLTDMHAESDFTRAIGEKMRAMGLHCVQSRCERISFLSLPSSWDAWLQSLHGDRRYRVRNTRKKLNAAHKVRFFVWDDPATLDQAVDRLVELHHKRWRSAGRTDHGFASAEYVGFHRAVMAACLKHDRLRFYCLELSGEIAAMFYFYRFRDTVFLMQSGFDPDHSALKPGQVLLGYIIEHAIGEGMKTLDFLRGEHRYKDELATGQRETVQVTAFRQTPGAWVYRTRRQILPALKAKALRAAERLRAARQGTAPEAA